MEKFHDIYPGSYSLGNNVIDSEILFLSHNYTTRSQTVHIIFWLFLLYSLFPFLIQLNSPHPTSAQPTFRFNRHFISVPAHFLSLPCILPRLNRYRYNRHSLHPTSFSSPKRCLFIIFLSLQLTFSCKNDWSENGKLIKLQ